MRRLLIALTLALVAAPALAKLPAELGGYKNLKFGMTPEQAQRAVGTARCWMGNRGTFTRCQRATDFKVAGLPTSYDLHFLEGKLFRIVVELELPARSSWPAFSAKYDELHALLVKQYGPPDEEQGEVFVELDAPLRAAKWHGPSLATALWVTASGAPGPAALTVAYIDLLAMARLGADRVP
jgi:hypothetical protein